MVFRFKSDFKNRREIEGYNNKKDSRFFVSLFSVVGVDGFIFNQLTRMLSAY